MLVPLFEEAGDLRVVLTRRTHTVGTHRGDVAFPGGRKEPGEDLVAAALREAEEEIGLRPDTVEVIGELDRLATVVSGYEITPIVGALPGPPAVVPNPAEIDRVFDVAVNHLLEEGVYHQEEWDLPTGPRQVHFFEVEDETVWGATARILHQLLCVLTGLPADPGSPL